MTVSMWRQVAVWTAAYWAAAVLGLQWGTVGPAGSPVWPAAGVAIAALALGGWRLWPAIFVGRLAAAWVMGSQHPWYVEWLMAGGNALSAVVAIWLMRHGGGFDPRLRQMGDVIRLLFGALVSAALAALIGTGALWLGTRFGGAQALMLAGGWFLGCLAGALTVAPLILAWAARERWRLQRRDWLHLALIAVATAAASLFIFLGYGHPWLRTWHLFPVLIWAALAFQIRGAAVALIVMATVAIMSATLGIGPLGLLATDAATNVAISQQMVAISSITVLLLAAVADERRGAEALRRSEERFRLLVDGVRDHALVMLDERGCVETWNTGAARLLGWPAAAIEGHRLGEFLPDRERFDAWLAEVAIAGPGATRHTEARWHRSDGREFLALLTLTALADDEGGVRGFALVTQDVTERRAAQTALQALNADLERRVAEGTARLVHLQKMESLGQLTGGIAHDFNNLIMAVQGNLELLRRHVGADDPRALRLIDNALQGTQRGASLTQRLLAFARRQELNVRPVAVPALIRDMEGLLQQSVGRVELALACDAAVRPALADPQQLELAILNLAINGRDAMRGSGRLVIEVDEIAPVAALPADHVRIRISDGGEGMDADTLRRATEPFFTTKGVGKGTGLGLSMVDGLVAQLGGRFTLTSQPGDGTTAEILLPVASAAVAELSAPLSVSLAAPLSAEKPASRSAGSGIVGKRVLLVDDDPLVLRSTAEMLLDLGCQVQTAGSGREALTLLESAVVDLLVSDQAMPEMSGTELTRAVLRRRPGLPVLLVSGYAELPAEQIIAGVPRLAKPFGRAELAAALEDLLRGTGSGSGSQRAT